MRPAKDFFRLTELDRTSFPEFRDSVLAEAGAAPAEPRAYPGYPRWPLPRLRRRWLASLDTALTARRSLRRLGTELPPRQVLARLLQGAHGVCADHGRGPVPSAGGLQALELYVVTLRDGWLPAGGYHYDRVGHHLSQVAAGPADWRELVPALHLVEGGALLWVIVGDGGRVEAKYGARGYRFLLLEAGHLMQNLCLLSASAGWATVPLGGFLEGDVARALALPPGDVVLYVGAAGAA
jgi:SagB-type dehydrogenase family enzyme